MTLNYHCKNISLKKGFQEFQPRFIEKKLEFQIFYEIPI